MYYDHPFLGQGGVIKLQRPTLVSDAEWRTLTAPQKLVITALSVGGSIPDTPAYNTVVAGLSEDIKGRAIASEMAPAPITYPSGRPNVAPLVWVASGLAALVFLPRFMKRARRRKR